MTTIAFDGKTLAGDTNWQTSFRQQHNTTKLVRHNGVVWGSAGCACDKIVFDEWMRAGCPADKKPKLHDAECFQAIVVENEKPVYYEGENLTAVPAGIPAATGSGCEIAMGAMMAGASARRAVEIAIQLDSGSGGKVRTLNCQKTARAKRR